MRCKLHCGYGRTLSSPGAGLVGIAPAVDETHPTSPGSKPDLLSSLACSLCSLAQKTLSLVPSPPSGGVARPSILPEGHWEDSGS